MTQGLLIWNFNDLISKLSFRLAHSHYADNIGDKPVWTLLKMKTYIYNFNDSL